MLRSYHFSHQLTFRLFFLLTSCPVGPCPSRSAARPTWNGGWLLAQCNDRPVGRGTADEQAASDRPKRTQEHEFTTDIVVIARVGEQSCSLGQCCNRVPSRAPPAPRPVVWPRDAEWLCYPGLQAQLPLLYRCLLHSIQYSSCSRAPAEAAYLQAGLFRRGVPVPAPAVPLAAALALREKRAARGTCRSPMVTLVGPKPAAAVPSSPQTQAPARRTPRPPGSSRRLR